MPPHSALNSACTPIIIWKLKYLYTMLRFQPGMFNSQHESSLKTLQSFVIKVTTMKNTDDSIVKWSHHIPLPNWHFLLSAKMKEDTGESIDNALCVLRYAIQHLSAMSNSEKIKPIASAIVKLWWSEGTVSVSQAGSQSMENQPSRPYCETLLWFMIILSPRNSWVVVCTVCCYIRKFPLSIISGLIVYATIVMVRYWLHLRGMYSTVILNHCRNANIEIPK